MNIFIWIICPSTPAPIFPVFRVFHHFYPNTPPDPYNSERKRQTKSLSTQRAFSYPNNISHTDLNPTFWPPEHPFPFSSFPYNVSRKPENFVTPVVLIKVHAAARIHSGLMSPLEMGEGDCCAVCCFFASTSSERETFLRLAADSSSPTLWEEFDGLREWRVL